MIIKKIDITGFGKFSNKVISFNEGFNLIHANNGEGKSTLMSFIKLMFYGNCGAGKSSDILKNPRKKYTPWNNSKMAGAIEFESNGNSIRLYKEFKKSTASDKITIHNLSTSETLPFSNEREVGSVFFDMELGEFERSVFVDKSSGFSSDASSDGLAMRIANLSVSGDENISQKVVSSRLNAAKEELVSKSGKKGILVETEALLESLIQEKESFLAFEDEQKILAEKTNQLEVEIKKLDNLKNVKNAAKSLTAYRLLQDKLLKRQEKLSHLKKYCSNLGVLRSVHAECTSIKHTLLDAISNAHNFSNKQQNLISENSLSLLKDMDKSINLIKADIECINSEIKPLQAEYNKALESAKARIKSKRIFWLVFSILSLLASVFLGVFVHIAGFSLILFSVISAIFSIRLSFNAEEKASTDENVKALNSQIDDIIFKKLQCLPASCSDFSPDNIEAILTSKFNSESELFYAQLSQYDCLSLEELTNKISSISSAYLNATNNVDSLKAQFVSCISSIFETTSYIDAEKTYADINQQLSELDSVSHDIETISTSLNVDNVSLNSITNQVEALNNLVNAGTDDTSFSDINYDEIEDKINVLRSNLKELYMLKKAPKTSISQINNRIDETTKKLAFLKNRYENLTLAIETLDMAISETNHGLGPYLNKKTGDYLNEISDGKYSEVLVSRDLEIQAKHNLDSEYHEWKFLSQGEIDKVYLALRIAATDVIAENHENLPLFLDDILSQYDEESCWKALEFLKNYLQNSGSISQILFFTCHSHIADMAKKIFTDLNEVFLA